MSRGQCSSAGNIILAEASYVNIAMDATYDISTNKIHADVEIYLTGNLPSGSNLSLVVALLQNNVEGPQVGKGSNPTQVLPNGNYNHNHMLRDLLVPSRFGDNVDFSAGPKASMSYVYDVPSDIGGVATVPADMEVVAYLLEVPSYEIVTGCQAEMLVGFLGEDELAVQNGLKVYPNPAKDHVNLNFDLNDNTSTQVEIFDLSGRMVKSYDLSYEYSGEYTERLDLSDLARGSYLLKANIDGKVATSKLVLE